MDEDTTFMSELQCARIRVKWDGKTFPQVIEVFVGPKRYEFQLWWEIQPFFSSTNTLREMVARSGLRDEEVGVAHAGRSVRSVGSRLEKIEGTMRVPSSREIHTYSLSQTQEVVDLGLGQARGAD